MSIVPPGPWRRAAIYGSLWAAVEIVVGSFLHNLRIPLAGSLLASFGVLVMTAAHRRAPERGLIWRAALVCALMKSISPSAVIIGPMVGIVMEGVLLEAMVRLSGGVAVGYLAGGALAVSWAMAQRVLNALISFGPDVVRLYVDAYGYAAKTLGVKSFGPFDLIAALVVIEMCAGVVAAALGLRAARIAIDTAHEGAALRIAPGSLLPNQPSSAEGHWSLRRLVIVATLVVVGMAGLGYVPLAVAAVGVAIFAGFVLRAYPRAAKRVRRPSLWIELALVMLLAGLVLGGVRNGLAGLLQGLAAGAAMTLRATMVVFGFTAISVELRNPAILAFVERRRLRGLSDALGMAFGTLPTFMAVAADVRQQWRRPLMAFAQLIHTAEFLVLEHHRDETAARVTIVSGETRSGKTTLVGEVVERLRHEGIAVAGILAPGYMAEGRRTGFDVVDLATGEWAPLAREKPNVEGAHVRWSRFAFDEQGLALGHRALDVDGLPEAAVVVVDEVGPMELSGGGWAADLDALVSHPSATLLLVVRSSLVDDVSARWGSAGTHVWEVPGAKAEEIVSRIQESGVGSREGSGGRDQPVA